MCSPTPGSKVSVDDLVVDDNDVLTDVSALHSIEEVLDDLQITNNDALSTEDAEALWDAIGTVGGDVTIEDNGGG